MRSTKSNSPPTRHPDESTSGATPRTDGSPIAEGPQLLVRLGGTLIKYQQSLTHSWLDGNVKVGTLLRLYAGDDFGLRALGYYCLESVAIPE
jgi:hypothetical protein